MPRPSIYAFGRAGGVKDRQGSCFGGSRPPEDVASDRGTPCPLCLWRRSCKEIMIQLKLENMHCGYMKFLSKNRLNLRHDKRYLPKIFFFTSLQKKWDLY